MKKKNILAISAGKTGYDGLFVTNSNPNGWAESIKKVIEIDGYYEFLSNNLYNLVANKYDIDKWNNKNIFIEVKERMNNYVQLDNFIKYSNEGWQCEQIKWNFLVGKISRYINIFRINGEIVIMCWNLNEIKHVSQTLRGPATTFFNTNHYKDKESILLKPEQGITYIYNLESDNFDIIKFDTLIHKLNKNVL